MGPLGWAGLRSCQLWPSPAYWAVPAHYAPSFRRAESEAIQPTLQNKYEVTTHPWPEPKPLKNQLPLLLPLLLGGRSKHNPKAERRCWSDGDGYTRASDRPRSPSGLRPTSLLPFSPLFQVGFSVGCVRFHFNVLSCYFPLPNSIF